jgi:hypothetical protein
VNRGIQNDLTRINGGTFGHVVPNGR